MDFAKRQLEKYGWKEGKGLGKNEDGMSTALKPTLKFDNTGVGHEVGKDFTNKWWENVFDNAAKNIEVVKDEKNIKVKRVDDAEEVEITTKDYSLRDFKKKNGAMEYGTFLKTAKLTQTGTVNFDNVHTPDTSEYCGKHLSDEELFAICGGRTAHKGARHGLKLSGKLSRIEKQEKILLKKMKTTNVGVWNQKMGWRKKLLKLGEASESMTELSTQFKSMASTSSTSAIASSAHGKKKKKKQRKKSVSFSETVLEYTVQEPDDKDAAGCSSSASVEKVEVHQRYLSAKDDDTLATTDEGIELDCDVKSLDCGQEVFSEMQHNRNEKKKKKAKKAAADKEDSDDATGVDIDEVVETKKKKKRERRDAQEMDIDGVRKIKKKKCQHREIEGISTTLDDLQISE